MAPGSEQVEAPPARPKPLPLPRRRLRLLRRAQEARTAMQRMIAVGVLLACGVGGYVTVLDAFEVAEEPAELHFGPPRESTLLAVSLEPVAIDMSNQTLQMRIQSLPGVQATNDEPAPLAERDLVLWAQRGSRAQQVSITQGESFPEVVVPVDLETGTIRDYPFDHYTMAMRLMCFERLPDGELRSVPFHVLTWEGLVGYTVQARNGAAARPNEIRLAFSVRRTGAASFFAIAAYGAMTVLAICAMTVGGVIFAGLRRIEVTLAGALAAIVFALPALRNALPGAPPLGVRADVLVFFWAEIAAVVALGLLISAWVRAGARD